MEKMRWVAELGRNGAGTGRDETRQYERKSYEVDLVLGWERPGRGETGSGGRDRVLTHPDLRSCICPMKQGRREDGRDGATGPSDDYCTMRWRRGSFSILPVSLVGMLTCTVVEGISSSLPFPFPSPNRPYRPYRPSTIHPPSATVMQQTHARRQTQTQHPSSIPSASLHLHGSDSRLSSAAANAPCRTHAHPPPSAS